MTSSCEVRLRAVAVSLLVCSCGGAGEPLVQGQPTAAFPTAWSGSSSCTADVESCGRGARCVQGRCVQATLSESVRQALRRDDVGLTVMRAVVQAHACVLNLRPGGILDDIWAADSRTDFAENLSSDGSSVSSAEALGEWLLLVHEYTRICGVPNVAERLEAKVPEWDAFVPESTVDHAVQSKSCFTMVAIQRMSLWPFEHRFAAEVASKNFAGADITRRLWIETLEFTESSCKAQLARRDASALTATKEKLSRIIGLDDAILIDLRSKLMDAMSANDSAAVAQYAHAVNEREQALDARQTVDEQARISKLQADLQAANAVGARQTNANATGTRDSAGGAVNGAIATANSVVDTADKAVAVANKAVKTAQQVKQTVQVVRSLFGL